VVPEDTAQFIRFGPDPLGEHFSICLEHVQRSNAAFGVGVAGGGAEDDQAAINVAGEVVEKVFTNLIPLDREAGRLFCRVRSMTNTAAFT